MNLIVSLPALGIFEVVEGLRFSNYRDLNTKEEVRQTSVALVSANGHQVEFDLTQGHWMGTAANVKTSLGIENANIPGVWVDGKLYAEEVQIATIGR